MSQSSVVAIGGQADPFAILADASRMRGVLTPAVRALWGADAEILDCAVAHLWRKTYRKAASAPRAFVRVCYRLELAQRAQQRSFTAWVHGIGRREGAVDDAGGAQAAPRSPRALDLRSHGLQLSLQRFPDDDGLSQLPLLVEPRSVLPMLAGMLARPLGGVDIEVVSYRPGERCTLRHEVRSARGAVTLFAKTFSDARGEILHERLHSLRLLARQRRLQAFTAQPLAYDHATRTVWQVGVSGALAADLVTPTTGETGAIRASLREDTLAACMRALASLHDSALPLLETSNRAGLLAETHKRARKMFAAHEELRAPLEAALRVCARELERLLDLPAVPVHADAHLGQFILGEHGAVLVDLDEMTLGDAEQDLASMALDLYCREPDPDAAARSADQALAAYSALRPAAIRPRLLQWHLCLQSITKAYRVFWKAHERSDPLVARLLARACDHARRLGPCPLAP